MRLIPVRVETPEQVDTVRRIRNRCAAGFSNFTDEISAEQQQQWWTEQGENVRAWLYLDGAAQTVGFGLLRRDPELDRWYTVVAVLPAYGGRGYGKRITAEIVERCPGKAYATARLDNPAAVKLHREEDWTRVDGPDPRLAYFEAKKNDEWMGP